MSGKEAKEVLNAMGGILVLCKIKALIEGDDDSLLGDLFNKYTEAVNVATNAIDIMDHQLEIENGEDNN